MITITLVITNGSLLSIHFPRPLAFSPLLQKLKLDNGQWTKDMDNPNLSKRRNTANWQKSSQPSKVKSTPPMVNWLRN